MTSPAINLVPIDLYIRARRLTNARLDCPDCSELRGHVDGSFCARHDVPRRCSACGKPSPCYPEMRQYHDGIVGFLCESCADPEEIAQLSHEANVRASEPNTLPPDEEEQPWCTRG